MSQRLNAHGMLWNFISSVLICCFLISVHFQYGKEVNGIFFFFFFGLGIVVLRVSFFLLISPVSLAFASNNTMIFLLLPALCVIAKSYYISVGFYFCCLKKIKSELVTLPCPSYEMLEFFSVFLAFPLFISRTFALIA